jgi:serine/threonine protein kinase
LRPGRDSWSFRIDSKGPINSAKGHPDAEQFHQGQIFMTYENGRQPFFFMVMQRAGKVEVHPTSDKGPNVTLPNLEDIQKAARIDHHNWYRTVIFANHKQKDSKSKETSEKAGRKKMIFSVDETVSASLANTAWYTCFPSIRYAWATGTLQEAISKKGRGNWSIDQHLELAMTVCDGIDSLHRKGFIHADIRPANILCTDDVSTPAMYALADYGSLAKAEPVSNVYTGNSANATVLGPVVAGDRNSLFYSRERSTGLEREDADIAVITQQGAGENYYLMLGWRKELIGEETKNEEVKKIITQKIDELQGKSGHKVSIKTVNGDELTQAENRSGTLSNPMPESKSINEKDVNTGRELLYHLVKGDRIQVRDYIFQIEATEWTDDTKQLLLVNKKHWKVFHGKIAVYDDEPFNDPHWFQIPRSIEFYKWAASTDMYSLGVLTLYSIYSEHMLKKDTSSSQNQTPITVREIEDGFRQMIAALSSPSYFNAIWLELESVRHVLEKHLANPKPEKYLAQEAWEGTDKENIKSFMEAVLARTNWITQTAPGAYILVEALGYQLGHFILLIHFALSCMHRQSDLKREASNSLEPLEFPFCKGRLEAPMPDGPASKAYQRLNRIRNLLANERLTSLKEADISRIQPYDPRPDSEIRYMANVLRTKVDSAIEGLSRAEDIRFAVGGSELKRILKETTEILRGESSEISTSSSQTNKE